MKKILSLLLALIMCVSLFPVSVLADDEELPDEPVVTEPAPEEEPVVEEPAPEETEPPVEEPPVEEPDAVPASEEELPPEIEAAAMVDGNVITEANFPDAAFRSYLLGLYPEGAIAATLAAVEELNVNSLGIESLLGIELFTGLKTLSCSGNKLTELKLAANTALTYLDCSHNLILTFMSGYQGSKLDLSANTALEYLNCSDNKLTGLYLPSAAALKYLDCRNNLIWNSGTGSDLYIIKTALEKLYCSGNEMRYLDMSGAAKLTVLDCSDNQISSLNVSSDTALTELIADRNCLEYVDLSSLTSLTRDCKASFKDQKISGSVTAYRLDGGGYLAVLEKYYTYSDDAIEVIICSTTSGGNINGLNILYGETDDWGEKARFNTEFVNGIAYAKLESLENLELQVRLPSNLWDTVYITWPLEVNVVENCLTLTPEYSIIQKGETATLSFSVPEPVENYFVNHPNVQKRAQLWYSATPLNDNTYPLSVTRSGNSISFSANSEYTVEAEVGFLNNYGSYELRSTVRVDFCDKNGKVRPTEPRDGYDCDLHARIADTKLDVELFKTDYPEINVFFELEQLARTAEYVAGNLPGNSGVTVRNARFNGALGDYFELRVKDDRTLIVVPKTGKLQELYNDPAALKAVPGKLTDSILLEINVTYENFEYDGTTDTIPQYLYTYKLDTDNEITVNIKKTTAPKVKVQALKLNSLDKSLTCSPVFSPAAKIVGDPVDWGNAPDWIDWYPGADGRAVFCFCGEYGAKVKTTLTLNVQPEGWAVTVPVKLNISAAPVEPKVTFDTKSVTLCANADYLHIDAAEVNYKISPLEFADRDKYHVSLSATENGAPTDLLAITGHNCSLDGSGSFRIAAARSDGKDHSLKLNLTLEGPGVKKTFSMNVKLKASPKYVPAFTVKKSGVIDLSVYGSTVTMQFSGKNINGAGLEDVFEAIYDHVPGAPDKGGYAFLDSEGREVYCFNYDASPMEQLVIIERDMVWDAPEPGTYTFALWYEYTQPDNTKSTMRIEVPFQVKQSPLNKVAPSATLKLKGKFNLVTGEMPDFSLNFKNFDTTGDYWLDDIAYFSVYRIYDAANKLKCHELVCDAFTPEFSYGDYDFSLPPLVPYDDFVLNPKDKLQIEVVIKGVNPENGELDSDYDFYAKPVALSIDNPVYKFAPSGSYSLRGSDCYDSFEIQGLGSVLPAGFFGHGSYNEITGLELDAKSSVLFDVYNREDANNAIEIGWKNNKLPQNVYSLYGKTQTVTVNIWFNGLEDTGAKPNVSFKIKVLVK